MSDPIFGTAPANVNLSESKTAGNNVAVIVLSVIATAAVSLRLWARSVQKLKLQADDYLVIVALVFVYCTASLSIAGGFFGAGKHVWRAATDDILMIMKILYGYTWIYGCSIAFTKLSIICFYHRIFNGTDMIFKCCLYIAGFLAACFPVMVITVMLGACRPLDYYWLQYTDPTAKGTCLKTNVFFLVAGVINMVIDIFILAIPIPKIYKLQMSKRRKLTVIGIMLLGGFVCVASIVRIYYLVVLQTSIDLTWIMGPVFIWSSVEPSIGILSACLPVLGPLLRVVFHNIVSSSDRKSEPITHAGNSSGWRNISTSKSGNQYEMSRQGTTKVKASPEEDEVQLTDRLSIRYSQSSKNPVVDVTQKPHSMNADTSSQASSIGSHL